MREIITSIQNAKIKNIVLLSEKSRERKKQDLIVVEGRREIFLALERQYELNSIFICKDIFSEENFHIPTPESKKFYISRIVFEKLALREGSDGIIALFQPKYLKLENIVLKQNPLIIVLESVEKPGNLGAILRTADAASVDAVVVCDPKTDIFNPNSIRSSVGCVFTNQVATASSHEVWEWLQKKNIKSYAAALTANEYYYNKNFLSGTAFIMGTEAVGLSPFWLQHATTHIKIPMLGYIDSLNVSASAAILIYEAVRQRSIT